MTEVSPEEWGNRYRNMRGTCEAMTGRLRTLIVDLLAEANIEVIQIEARTKAVENRYSYGSRRRWRLFRTRWPAHGEGWPGPRQFDGAWSG